MLKKLIILSIIIIYISGFVFSWEEEDLEDKIPINPLGSTNGLSIINPGSVLSLGETSVIDKNIYDFYIYSPVNSFTTAIDFRLALVLADNFVLTVAGSFVNFMNGGAPYRDDTIKEWYEDAAGEKAGLRTETVEKYQNWDAINNSLWACLGWDYSEKFAFDFILGGASEINDYYKKEVDYQINYAADGTITAPYIDETSDVMNGVGHIGAGIGIKLKETMFNQPLIPYLNIYQYFDVGIIGNGSHLGASTSKTTQTKFNTDEDIVKKTYTNNVYEYFSFEYIGGVLVRLDFHEIIKPVSNFHLFYSKIGLNYSIGFRNYNKDNGFYQLSREEYLGVDGPFNDGDYLQDLTKTVINNLYGNVALPLMLDIRPIPAVQMMLSYVIDFQFDMNSVEQTLTHDENVGGVSLTSVFPTDYLVDNNYTLDHFVGIRFRFEFPQVVRLTLGAEYNIEQSFRNDSDYRDNNTIDNSPGGKTGPGTNDIPYTGESDYEVIQNVNPYLELDFEIVKDYAYLNLTWNPSLALATATDSNILNLACWQLECLIKFSPKSLGGK